MFLFLFVCLFWFFFPYKLHHPVTVLLYESLQSSNSFKGAATDTASIPGLHLNQYRDIVPLSSIDLQYANFSINCCKFLDFDEHFNDHDAMQ